MSLKNLRLWFPSISLRIWVLFDYFSLLFSFPLSIDEIIESIAKAATNRRRVKLQKEEGQVRVTGLYFLKKKLPKGQAPKMSSFKSVTTIKGLRRCLENDKKLYVRSIPDGVLKIEAKRRRIKRENGVERILSSYEQLLEKNKELSNSFAKLNLEFQEFRSLQEKLQGDSVPQNF